LITTRGKTIHSQTHKLINSFWNKEELPEEWKESIIVPVYSKGEKTECITYLRISLLSSTYRILSCPTPYAEENIGDHQCKFRHNRSTTDPIFCTLQIFKKNWKYNEAGHHLFIDFKKD